MPAPAARLDEMVALLKELVECESPSKEKAAVDRMGIRVAEECRRLGAEVKLHPQTQAGDLVEASFNPAASPREKGLLLLAHMDTVFPLGTLAKMPFVEKDGKLHGPGTQDMKGGIVVGLEALRAAQESGKLRRPVTALFTSDEETGSACSREWIEELARQSALVLVLEPAMPDGAVKTWRKGVGDFVVTVHGKAAHAGGDHEIGRNAIEEMAHQVIAIQKLTDYNLGTTLNVGVIRGGTVVNAVPDECAIQVDLRVMQPGEAERIQTALKSLRPVIEGTRIEVTGGLNRPPMPFDGTMQATFEKAKAIAARAGLEIQSGGTGGASDGNFVAPLGIPVLDGLGPVGEGEHSEREYILKDSLLERARLVEALLCEW
jgi:glutamate carboxypeptidase